MDRSGGVPGIGRAGYEVRVKKALYVEYLGGGGSIPEKVRTRTWASRAVESRKQDFDFGHRKAEPLI